MKIAGQKLLAPKPIALPFSRRDKDGNEMFIVITVQPVLDLSEFETKFPVPQAPMKKKGTVSYMDDKDPTYMTQMLDYVGLKMNWMILEALKPSKITWDNLTDDPTTWATWREEFTGSGFSNAEVQAIENEIYDLSGLTTANMEEARKRFLVWKAAQAGK